MAKVSERRLRKLEWAALDTRTRRRWGGFLREQGVPLAHGLADMRRRFLIAGLGLWSQYEQQLAAQAGCSVAELRREGARIVAEAEARSTAVAAPAAHSEHPCPYCAERGEMTSIPAGWKHCGCLRRDLAARQPE